MQHKPIKRHKALQGISREHHHGLLLCWKIRMGFKNGVDPERIRKYADWFYKTHLVPHFELEEKHVFPVLGKDHALVNTALGQHQNLHELFKKGKDLALLETRLEQHIRFEERVLFKELQERATEEQLSHISKMHQEETFCENTDDPFWLR
ncbi:hemerythrin domain-containing protein [Maribacter sp. 2307ULW6-5]|uniref:hemerythrin domain-containing protein n=1 Tax=Maribacter sp. 2307ULW6-5 TaxID=3386275 RepID=UPI0039BCD493